MRSRQRERKNKEINCILCFMVEEPAHPHAHTHAYTHIHGGAHIQIHRRLHGHINYEKMSQ